MTTNLAQLTLCPICNCSLFTIFKQHLGYQESQTFDLLHCSTCNTSLASPLQIDQRVYDHIYKNVHRVPGYDRYLKYADEVLIEENPLQYLAESEDVYWGVQEALKGAKKEVKILEVGCGFGYLTYALVKAGYDTLGVDISSVAIEAAIKRYGPYFKHADIFKLAEQQVYFYDIILLTEVIEHVPNPKDFLKALYKLLKPQGKLLLTTPNKSAYPSEILWETEPPPVHLWWFSEDSISYLAKECHYQSVFLDFSCYNQLYPIEAILHALPYQPTRLPRLDSKGAVIDYNQRGATSKLKNALKRLGLFNIVRKAKHTLFPPKSYFRDVKEKRRPVLVAVLQKYEKHP